MKERGNLEGENNKNYNSEEVKVEFKTLNVNGYEEESNKGSNYKKVLTIATVIVVLIAIGSVLWVKGYDIVNYVVDSATDIEEYINEEEVVDEINNNVASTSVNLDAIYENIHYMVNTIIIAEDGNIWGKEDITMDRIKSMISSVEGNDEYLFQELSKWENLDFSNGVKVHNYVWDKLGGTVGKAKALNEENINDLINKLSE